MPIYEYLCQKCRKEFELMRSISDMDKPASCPSCGARGERLMSACASKIGFYVKTPSSKPFRKLKAGKEAKTTKPRSGKSKK